MMLYLIYQLQKHLFCILLTYIIKQTYLTTRLTNPKTYSHMSKIRKFTHFVPTIQNTLKKIIKLIYSIILR